MILKPEGDEITNHPLNHPAVITEIILSVVVIPPDEAANYICDGNEPKEKSAYGACE